EFIARTKRVVKTGRWMAHAPIEKVQFGVIRSDQPRRGAAVFQHSRIPGFGTRLTRRWDGVKPPDMFAGLRVVSVQVSAMRVFAAGAADDDFVFDYERRRGDVASALAHVFDLDVPDFAARPGVQRDHVVAERAEIDSAVSHGQSARA